ncbi:MAG: hypothetical protein KIT87_21650 [Anaerolineae bacterium]|nr:hypothetical protein [Anaerolineae bacterium]
MNQPALRSRGLTVHTLAIAFSLAHMVMDWWAGLLGPFALPVPVGQVGVLVLSAGMYALWARALVLGSLGSRSSLVSTMLLSALASLNGFSIVACLPPCGGAYSVADLAHIGSLVFCLWAILESWQALKRLPRASARHMEQTA